MQIHEITRPITEGILDAFSPAARAARTAASLSAQGYGPSGADPDNPRQKQTAQALSTDWKVKLQNIQKDPAVTQYLNSLIKGWELKQKQLQAEPNKAQTPPAQSKQPQAQKQAQKKSSPSSVQSITLGGQLLTKGDDGLWHSEDGRAVTDTAQAAKIDKAYQGQEYRKKQFQQTAIIKEAPDNSQSDTIKAEFIEWTDGNLASRDSYYNNITMKDVRDNVAGIADILDQKLDAVVAQQYAPAAVKDYLQTAIAGVQARSQQLKNKEPQANLASRSRAQAKLGDIQQTLTQAGINPEALSAVGQNATLKNVRATGNDVADALLNQAGFKL